MPRNLLSIILLILSTTLGAVTGNVTTTGFARLQYDGGGDWYNDPEVLPNLARFVNASLNTTFPSTKAWSKPAKQSFSNILSFI